LSARLTVAGRAIVAGAVVAGAAVAWLLSSTSPDAYRERPDAAPTAAPYEPAEEDLRHAPTDEPARSTPVMDLVGGRVIDAVTGSPLQANVAWPGGVVRTDDDGTIPVLEAVPVGEPIVVTCPGYVTETRSARRDLGVLELVPEFDAVLRFVDHDGAVVRDVIVRHATGQHELGRSDASGTVTLAVGQPYEVLVDGPTGRAGWQRHVVVAPLLRRTIRLTDDRAVLRFVHRDSGQPATVDRVLVRELHALHARHGGEARAFVSVQEVALAPATYRVEVDASLQVGEPWQIPFEPGGSVLPNVAWVDLTRGNGTIDVALAPSVRIRLLDGGLFGDPGELRRCRVDLEVLEDELFELGGWVTVPPSMAFTVRGDLLHVHGVDRHPEAWRTRARLRIRCGERGTAVLPTPSAHVDGPVVELPLQPTPRVSLAIARHDGSPVRSRIRVRERAPDASPLDAGTLLHDAPINDAPITITWSGGDLLVGTSANGPTLAHAPRADLAAAVANGRAVRIVLPPMGRVRVTIEGERTTGEPVHDEPLCFVPGGDQRRGRRTEAGWIFDELAPGVHRFGLSSSGGYRGADAALEVGVGTSADLVLRRAETSLLHVRCDLIRHAESRTPLVVSVLDAPTRITASQARDLRPIGDDGFFVVPDVGARSTLVFFAAAPGGVLVPLDACPPRASVMLETARLRIRSATPFDATSHVALDGPMQQLDLDSGGVVLGLGRGTQWELADIPCHRLRVTIRHRGRTSRHEIETTPGALVDLDADG
jgi:hypothetical protein